MAQTMIWDSPAWRELRDRKFAEWFGADGAACLVLLSTVSETWDDLIDKDVQVSSEDVTHAFTIALIKLELNPFWQKHKTTLFPGVIMSVNAWLDANDLMLSRSTHYRMQAFYLRNLFAEMAQIVAFCHGGFEHMREVSLAIRTFLNHETFEQWETEHVNGRRRRTD